VTGDHSGHTEAGGVPVRVEQTERSFTQATESAMGNDILMGLIELITNADDQYGDQPGSILVRFPKPDAETTWDVEVRDKASGLGYDEIGPKLLRFGGRTSGHEAHRNTVAQRPSHHVGRTRAELASRDRHQPQPREAVLTTLPV
jgi:hypothetical protein